MSDSAATWVDALADRPIPALKANIERCRELLDRAASHSALGDVINQDPGLACLFFRHINKSRVQKNRPLISTITSSLNLLGSEAIQNLLSQARILEDEVTQPAILQLWLSQLLRAYHAARLAETWAEAQGDRAPSEVYIATFLMGVGEFCIGSSDPEKLSALASARLKQNRKEAEITTIGTTTFQVGAELARRWGLPELLQDALNPDLKLVHRVQPCILADGLAYETSLHGWLGDPMETLYEQAASLFGKEPHKAASQIHEQTVSIAREWHLPGVRHAAARLVETGVADNKPEAEAAAVSPALTGATQDEGELAMKKTVADLKQALADQGSSSELLKACLQSLRDHFGFDRCLLMLPDGKTRRLMIRAAPGFPRSPLLSKPGPAFDKPGIFRTALGKVQGLTVNDEVYQTIAGSLPEGFLKLTQSANFILFSVAMGKKPAAIIYADKAGHALNHYQVREANRLAVLMSKALTQTQAIRQS